MKKYFAAFAAGVTFMPLIGLWILHKIYDILEEYDGEAWNTDGWTAEEWALWWGEEL